MNARIAALVIFLTSLLGSTALAAPPTFSAEPDQKAGWKVLPLDDLAIFLTSLLGSTDLAARLTFSITPDQTAGWKVLPHKFTPDVDPVVKGVFTNAKTMSTAMFLTQVGQPAAIAARLIKSYYRTPDAKVTVLRATDDGSSVYFTVAIQIGGIPYTVRVDIDDLMVYDDMAFMSIGIWPTANTQAVTDFENLLKTVLIK